MAEDRLDRLERILEHYTEESNQRMTRLERILASFSNDVARNTVEANLRISSAEVTLDRLAELLNRSYHQSSERLDRIEEQTARNAQQIQFLRELMQGHISQSTPPAHAD
ncbi:MAG: hypothetical protein F4X62_08935 [Caldilineaceae bacterium SB0662_bin_25]|nr:hypothetical protein [Caldilineaceae bacterium SB0662_bin_25]